MPADVEAQGSGDEACVEEVARQRVLGDGYPIHLRNQHPTPPTLATICFEPLHLRNKKLRQHPSYLRPSRLFLRQHHLHIRIPTPQIRHQRTIH